MTALYMLDTNTVSYIVRNRSHAARSRLENLGSGEVICISAISEAEIRYGLAKKQATHLLRFAMERFLTSIRILPWTSQEASTYGTIRNRLDGLGKPLGNLDMLIAAHAVSANAILVTNDKAFRHVDELQQRVAWATDL